MERGPPAIYLINAAFISTTAVGVIFYTYGPSFVPSSGTPWMFLWYIGHGQGWGCNSTEGIDVEAREKKPHNVPESLLSRGLGLTV